MTSPSTATKARRRSPISAGVSPDGAGAVRLPPYVFWLTTALAVAAALSGVLTYVVDDELAGTPVMNGSARGTALVLFAVAVPVLVIAMVLAGRGSVRAVFVWFGAALYMTYNALLLVLGTPLNRFFLVYVATLTLAAATAVAAAVTAQPERLARCCSPRMPVRGLAVYLWVIVGLNTLAWLGRIVPATINDDAPSLLEGTGLSMVPTYLQDLAFWLPLFAVAGAWLWRRLPWGFVLAGGAFVFWAIEGVTVATDQWFGHRADPTSSVASDAAVVPFVIASIVGIVTVVLFLRHVGREPVGQADATIDLG